MCFVAGDPAGTREIQTRVFEGYLLGPAAAGAAADLGQQVLSLDQRDVSC